MSQHAKEAILCIGSNCGDRIGNVALALAWLAGRLEDFRHSSIYATPDCYGGQREYLNAVCAGWCDLSMEDLNSLCKDIEISLGRTASTRRSGDVPVDVDIVVFDGNILRKRDYDSEFFLIGYRKL